MYIDPHVHCRDWEQAYKETVKHALSVAEKAGFTAIFDMPNTKPPIDSRELAVKRLELAKRAESPVFYGLYMALTADPNQIKEAVETYNGLEQVVGFKLYAGHSVGRIGVIDESEQKRIYQTLAKENYQGVVVLHCEKESLIKDWNPESPESHAMARPWQAEVESLKDQLNFAKEYGFKGTLHIAHTSVPQSVSIVNNEKDLNVTCGVCPHHILLNYTAMKEGFGVIMKMNPPLRPTGMNIELLELLKQGKIDWVETDHAPHTLKEKLDPPYMSGVTGLQKYPKFINWLRNAGLTEERMRDITFNNINKTFGLDLKIRECEPILDLEHEYEFDPYRGFNVLD